MSTHLARAELLLEQNRFAEALTEARAALQAEPDSPTAHACLARCFAHLDEPKPALASAQQAVSFAPDEAYFHQVLAFIHHRADRNKAALVAINEAVRLEPYEENYLSLRSAIHLGLKNWADALADAENALQLDPENIQALNIRSIALIQLGRADKAHQTGDYTLERAPENGMAHATKGWASLHQGDPLTAQSHFREALRLQADLEYARTGMLEALKARNPIYRWMLAYFLWMGRQATRMQWAFIILTMFGVRIIRGIAATTPVLGWVLWPLVGLIYFAIYLTWTAVPLFNFLLCFDRFGRYVLSRAERRSAINFGLSLLPLFASLYWWATGAGDAGLFASIMAAMLSVCVASSVQRTGRNRLILGGITGGLAAAAIAILFFGQGDLIPVFFLSFLGFQFAANALSK
jgi:tetratricopeptide (TPR) repeat protein